MISCLAIIVSLESVLSKSILVGTVKLSTLGKTAVVAKRVVRSSELGFDLPIPFSGFSFMGAQTPEFMTPIGQPIETLDQCPHSVNFGVEVEKLHPEARL